MADKKGIEKLDEKLADMKIIPETLLSDLPLVHRKMNSILKKTGAVLSDEIFETGNAALREWLVLLSRQGASQEKLTGYLRCGLAHLTYDYIESQYHQISLDDLVSRTLVSFKKRKLHTSFFKPPAEPESKPSPKSASSIRKIVAIKKSELGKINSTAKTKPKNKANPAAKVHATRAKKRS